MAEAFKAAHEAPGGARDVKVVQVVRPQFRGGRLPHKKMIAMTRMAWAPQWRLSCGLDGA